MIERNKIKWVYIVSAVFIALNAIFIANEFFWLPVLPAILFIMMLYLFALDKLLLIITFLTPIAVNIKDFDVGFGISLPTEPLMAGVLLVFVIKVIQENSFDIRITRHPVSIAIIIYLVWIFITAFTSEIMGVSFKFLAARLWFVIPFYFVATQLFKNQKNIKAFVWVYVISLVGVIFYTIINHSQYGFEEDPGHWVMTPFYNDHTAYGAILAMFIPVIAGFSLSREYNNTLKVLSFIVLVILILAIVLSYSRAAWVSVGAAFFVFIIIILRIRLWIVVIGFGILMGTFFVFQDEIIMKLEKNKQDSSAHFVEHVQSISNISSDASNLERINRWQSAIRMFKERPFRGWGPGTYQFIYAPFQFSRERTIISTNSGDKGNAHSEYIGPLSESGILGLLSFLAIVICVIYTAIKVFRQAVGRETKLISLVLLLGLITYFIHGTLNNFLDSDKASVPFWGFIAALVAMDVYHKKKSKAVE